MSGIDIELLESFLDGALPAAEADALRGRLVGDLALSAELDRLRAQRKVRASAFASMEADDAMPDRLLATVAARHERPAKRVRWNRPLRYATAAAACIAIGFAVGQLVEVRVGRGPAASPQTAAHVYQVAITDDAGGLIAVQKFESLEQATEFSEDLRRWQERQEHVRNGQVTLRSARF